MRRRDATPYFTTAVFRSICPESGKTIKRGDPIAYFPATRRAYADGTKAAQQVRGLDFARSFAMPDADY